jgi:hypothetical protein
MSRLENVFRNSEMFPEFHLIVQQMSSYQTGEALLIFSFAENMGGGGTSFPRAVPWGCRRPRLLEFVYTRHIKVVRLSALGTGRLYPFISVISVRGWVNPRAIERP